MLVSKYKIHVMKKILLSVLALGLFSCAKDSLSDQIQKYEKDVQIHNIGDSGLNLTVSLLSSGSTRSTETETYLLIIEDSTANDREYESLVEVKRLPNETTLTTHKTVDGEVLATYVCSEDGQLIQVDVPEEYVVSAQGIGGWFREWKLCVKSKYQEMMTIIREDAELSRISDANSIISNLPIITEVEVAVAAGIWCAKNK